MNMFRRILQLFIFILVSTATSHAADLPTLDQIVDRYIEALGGREAIATLETRTITGKQIDDRPYKGDPVATALEAWSDCTGKFAMVLHEAGGDFRTTDQDDHNAKLAFVFNPQGPLMLAEHFPHPRLTGTWEYDGKLYYKVENDLKFEYYTLYFEVETGMLTRIGYHWMLEDFRAVDGVLVPFTVVQGRKGGSTNLYFETVTHNAEVADHLESSGR